jgi:Fe/S biogenesis protein NfuA
VEFVTALTPVRAVPLANRGGDVSSVTGLFVAPERELPTDVGFDIDVTDALVHGHDVQGATGAAGKAGTVEKDARVIDESRHNLSVALHPGRAVAPLLLELPLILGEALRGFFHAPAVLFVHEVRPVAAAPLGELLGRSREHALAPAAVDALPRALEKGDVKDPGLLSALVLETHPLVRVRRNCRHLATLPGAHWEAEYPYTSDVAAIDTEQTFSMTPEARGVVADALAAEGNAGALALYVEVTGVKMGGYAYDLYFSELADADTDATIVNDGEIAIVIPAASLPKIVGSRLEFSEDGGGGLVLVNPNAPAPAEANPGIPAEVLAKGLGTPLAQRAMAVIDQYVNPAIASHGGRADLVAMDDDKMVAFVRLSGGCQGCAMSRMTLSQGIETTLREEIPELVGVLDVTDHTLGENPFYS